MSSLINIPFLEEEEEVLLPTKYGDGEGLGWINHLAQNDFEAFLKLSVGQKAKYYNRNNKSPAVGVEEIYSITDKDLAGSEVVFTLQIKLPLALVNKCGERPTAKTFEPVITHYLKTIMKMLTIHKRMKDERQALLDCTNIMYKHFRLFFSKIFMSSKVDYHWMGERN